MKASSILCIAALLSACSDPMKKAQQDYQTALESQIELNINDDAELCRLSRKAQRIALQQGDKGAYGEWSLRTHEYCQ